MEQEGNSVNNSLEVLAQNRDALLLAEVTAWLHMIGKFQEDFLNGKYYLATEVPSAIKKEAVLSGLFTDSWTGSIWSKLPIRELNAQRLNISRLITSHEKSLDRIQEGFLKLVRDAHGRGSGIEKGVLNRFASSHKAPVYLSTALGFEDEIKLIDIKNTQQGLYDFLRGELSSLKLRNASFDYEGWLNFRHSFISALKRSFSITVAETRRPLNDITLLDQTAISVGFFKAALAQNLLIQWKDPSQDKVSDMYHWRFLRVGLDGLTFWGNSSRIGDVLARKELIETVLDEIQSLLEVAYPLGFEVYRDGNSGIFIVPDVDGLLNYSEGGHSLKGMIQTIADKKFDGETILTISPSGRTRDALVFGALATEAFPLPNPRVNWLVQQWRSIEKETCPVCGLRPQGPDEKARSRKVCNTCLDRRTKRSREWMLLPSTTIWIDEVADNSGYLVLLVAQFGISEWLSGLPFNTIVAFDPESRQLDDREQESRYPFDLSMLIQSVQDGLEPAQEFKDDLLGHLVLEKQRGGSRIVQDFYDLHVTHTDLESFSPNSEPELLALSMIRQPPSFARIYRVWETTKKFWEDIEAYLKNNLEEATGRLRIRGVFLPNAKSSDTLGVSHAYEVRLDRVNVSVVCVKEGEFLTVDNLYRTATLLNAPDEYRQNYDTAVAYVGGLFREREVVTVEEPTGYGSPNRELGTLRIESVSLERSPYLPAISILTEPRTFMALVPAEKALKVAEAIQKKYEREMSKVRNRLPLKMGIVFAGSRTPLPAVLDTGRRMLRQPTQGEYWKMQVNPDVQSDRVKLTLEKDGQKLHLEVRTVMGDGKTEDVWYPYWHVQADKDNLRPRGRKRQFVGVEGKDWVHVCDLREGDTVYLMPSRFDFEWLDAAARRFEVSYEGGKRRGDVHTARPYYLEQLESFKGLWGILRQGLVATSQIHNLVGLIEQKRLEWKVRGDNEVFRQLVRDILRNAEWKEPHPEKEQFEELIEKLVQAGVSGQLADVVEFYSFLDEELRKTVIDQRGGTL